MNYWNRIKNILIGVFVLLFALMMALAPKEAYPLIAALISMSLLIYGFRMLWFYFRMARHMVGGKSILYQAAIVLDLSLFTSAVISMSSVYIMLYLLGIYAFSGAIGILRALEAKRYGAPSWQFKLASGIISVLFAAALAIVGVIVGNTAILVYGYCLSLAYSAVIRIVTAFRRTAIVYIQ